MAKRVKPSKTKVAQLGRTQRRTEQVIAGGIRPLVGAGNGVSAADAPLIAIWLDSATGAVRAAKPIKPGLPQDEMWGEALDTLADACIAPVPGPFSGGASDDEYATTNGMLFSLPMPYLPGKIMVNDEGLAQAAHAIFDPLGVPIEYSASLPGFDAAYASLTSFMGLDEEPPEPFAWHVDEVLLQPLYAAARKYWQAAPWEMLPDHPPVEVALGELGPERGVETLYGAIIGAGGEAFGVALYYSLDDYLESLERGAELSANDADVDEMIEMLRQSGAPVEGLPPEVLRGAVGSLMGRMDAKSEGAADSADDEDDDDLDDAHLPDNIALIFMEARETDPTYLDWLKARGLKYPSRKAVPQFLRVSPDHDPRALTNREAQAMMLSVEAITAFTQIMAPVFTQGMMPAEPLTLPISVKEGDQTRTIRVTFPPPGRDWSEDFATGDEEVEEPEQPATEAGRAMLYRFKVTLEVDPPIWRRIELRGDQTLHDLHRAIQEAFEWDDDHLYAFYLSGKYWDRTTEYGSPFNDDERRSAAGFRLEHLPLTEGKTIAYIFDFGDEWRHRVKLEKIIPDGVRPNAIFPRTTEVHGAAVPQYPDYDEEDGDDEPE